MKSKIYQSISKTFWRLSNEIWELQKKIEKASESWLFYDQLDYSPLIPTPALTLDF